MSSRPGFADAPPAASATTTSKNPMQKITKRIYAGEASLEFSAK